MKFSHGITFATIVNRSRSVEFGGSAYCDVVYLKKTSDQMLLYSWSLKTEDIQRIKFKLIPGNI